MHAIGKARPRIWLAGATAFLTLQFLATSLPVAEAQRIRVLGGMASTPDAANDDTGPNNFSPPDRNVLQVLNRAKKALNDRRYGEALEGLAEVLRNSEDYLYQPDKKSSIYPSLKTEARQLLGQMPREGRDLYEVRNGSEARDRLKRAVAAGDANALAEISGQFFHTQAGYEATYLSALHHMDHGAPLAGALTLKRLREAGEAADAFEPGLSLTQAACYYQAGMPQQCQQVLVDLKRRVDKPSLQIGDRRIAWFERDSEAPEWLAKLGTVQRMAGAAAADQWTMFRGDPSRTAYNVGSAPLLNLHWVVEVAEDKAIQDGLRQLEASYRQQNYNVLSALQPLAVGDYVFMRTTNRLLGVDFNDGKRVWDDSIVSDETKPEPPPVNPNMGWRVANNNTMSLPAQYGQRVWDDATYGTLSSDGKLVFAVEQLGLGVSGQYQNMIVFGGGRGEPSAKGASNSLAAFEIASQGKLRWCLDGQDALQRDDFRDTFFLGAPLPLRGQLFAIAEIKEEIRLLALEAETGKLLWKQQLSMVEANVLQDPVRRLAGVSPSYSDGILICPTGAGCVVAVDLATRSLLWGYVYEQGGGPIGNPRRFRGMNPVQQAFMNNNNNTNAPVPRWLDGAAVIAGGRVLLTPAEADALYCLNLADGKPAWKEQPRGDHYYIACVHEGKVVLVGRTGVDAVRLSDGGKAWNGRTIVYPGGANVTGHGFYAGNRYYVPLSTGEVAAIDLDAGKIVAIAKSRKGIVPGNLVCYRGRVISQGPEGVELYYQVDAARAESSQLLAKNPDDVEGLTLRGEIAMDEGRSTEAVADFRRAYAIDKSDSRVRTRDLLRDALLIGLRDNFAVHRSLAGELEKLLDEPPQKAAYYRYMASGLLKSHEWQAAVDFCMKLVDMDEKELRPEIVERSHLARRDRWVQARLKIIRDEGGEAAAEAIDKALAMRLDDAKGESGTEALKRFVGFFDGQPQAAVARTELLERLRHSGNVLGAELLLASTTDASDRKAQAALLFEMTKLNVHANRSGEAAACYRQLAQQFADVPCCGGLTPAAWMAGLQKSDSLRKEIDRPLIDWPKGLVEVNKGDAATGMSPLTPQMLNRQRFHYDIPFTGPTGPYYSDYAVCLDANQQELILRDGWGRTNKPAPMRVVENGRNFPFYNTNATTARSCGHLLLISAGTKIFALDPWRASGSGSQILWSQDLADTSSDTGVINGAVFAVGVGGGVVFAGGGPGISRANPFGPVTARMVCFQRLRNLVAVDTLSGEPLWVRQDIPENSEVFGDDQYVFVASPGKNEAAVYRATDGEYLADRKLPRGDATDSANGGYYSYDSYNRTSPLVTSGSTYIGGNVLTWRRGPSGTGRVLSLFDLWRQRPVWRERTFASTAKIDVIEQNAVAVMEPNGHFVLVDLADGHSIADLRLKVRSGLSVTDLAVLRMGDQYIVIAQDRSGGFNGITDQLQPPQGSIGYGLRKARLYAIDLQGKSVWPEPVDIDHHCFLLGQPARLPVLLCGCSRYENVNNQTQMHFVVLAVDRCDGRVVYDKNDGSGGNINQIGVAMINAEGDPSEKTVRIQSSAENVVLNFTDKPVKDPVRKATGVHRSSNDLGGALLDAVKRAMGDSE